MSSLTQRSTGKAYWRSLDELADSPEFRAFVEKEFASYAPELLSSPSRRQFLKVMGASLALAGLTGCRWPKENIMPQARQPGNRTPGKPEHYATAWELGGVGTGLLVCSYDGRPVKVEGNPLHPFSLGASDSWMQASILEMYDPDRSRCPLQRSPQGGGHTSDGSTKHPRPTGAAVEAQDDRTWDEFLAFAKPHFAELRSKQGAGLCILSEASSSPSVADMRDRLTKAMPQARWFEYEAISFDNALLGGKLAFGKPHRAQLALEKADVIACLDADLLMTHPAKLRYTRDYSRRRRADDGTMNRLYVVESGMSLTGSLADHRCAIRSADVARFALDLAAELMRQGLKLPASAAALSAILEKAAAPVQRADFIQLLARDLKANAGKSVIAAGPRQPAEVHALVAVLNEALGNVGKTVTYTEETDRPTHAESITALADLIEKDSVDTLVIVGGNALYDVPPVAGDDPAAASLAGGIVAKVKTSIHLSVFNNATSRACTWHIPRAHVLESWGDVRAYDGTVSIVQPLIEPMYGGKTTVELLALMTGDPVASGYEIVKRTFATKFSAAASAPKGWETALHDGVVPDTRWPEKSPTVAGATWGSALAERAAAWTKSAPDQFELVFVPDLRIYDGRFANSGWLQELPDPLTKITWDNAAILSPVDAGRLGVEKNGDIVFVSIGKRSVAMPAYMLPGHAVGSITLPLGYGQQSAGLVAEGVGHDVGRLRTRDQAWIVGGAKVARGQSASAYMLSTTQDHHAIESRVGNDEIQRRLPELFREGTLDEFKHEPQFAKHVVHTLPLLSLWQEPKYEGNKWGMAIDLTACTGCSACVVACQAENNIPVVGKEEVNRGREMHWIRIDRYFRGDPAAPDVEIAHQPVPCMHCENAPCETVCPVAATMHDTDGLNVMVYNRCVGTRYCSNNCPYKVRRFNWFYNHHGPYHPRSQLAGTASPGNLSKPSFLKQLYVDDVEMMGFNPEVTVRSRGVMEKCTYCVQRINAVKIVARNEKWPSIPDGSITPACAQACPAEAIVFGDLNDPGSRVRKLRDHDRSYIMLEELNNKPRTSYMAKLRNPAENTGKPAAPHDDSHAKTEHKV